MLLILVVGSSSIGVIVETQCGVGKVGYRPWW